jgi:5-formyltetrahydrofolate cyclo-ligase
MADDRPALRRRLRAARMRFVAPADGGGGDGGATIGPRWLDPVLVPLVGFDPRGHRIGMGAGLYDRHFAFLRHRRTWRRPLLDGVVTERGVYGRIACR